MVEQSHAAPSTARSVSVVVPTHNRRHLVERALSCVLGQQDVDVQAIVVNDGSSDDTAEYLDGLLDRRVEVVHLHPSRRVGGARNAGLALCAHPWVAFLDDDDVWGPRRLATQLDALASTGDAWAVSDAVLVDEQMRVLSVHAAPVGVDVRRDLLRKNIIPGGGSGVIARTELVRRLGGFDTEFTGVEDWDLWIRLAQVSPLTCVQSADVGYLLHNGSMSRKVAQMTASRNGVLRRYASLRSDTGLDADDEWWDSYILGLHLSSGRGLAAARRKMSMVKSPRPRQLAAVLAVLAAPKAVERRHHRRLLSDYDPARIAEADAWLAHLRSTGAQQLS